MSDIKLGCHVGMAGKDMFLASAREAASYGANVFMLYTGAPQNTRRKEIFELNIDAGWEYAHEHGIEHEGDEEEQAWQQKQIARYRLPPHERAAHAVVGLEHRVDPPLRIM